MKQHRSETIFDTTMSVTPGRNYFDLSHEKKLTCNMGKLVPMMCMETLPGDNFKVNSQNMVRFQSLVSPVMHRMDVYTHFFFVPNRLIWSNWEQFITGGEEGSAVPVVPFFGLTTDHGVGRVSDYLGYPTLFVNPDETTRVSALPIAAHNKIINDYFRDENLKAKLVDQCSDGGDNSDLSVSATQFPYTRAWEHDYFTSALPWAQKGDEVNLPIGGEAPIVFRADGHSGIDSRVFLPNGGTLDLPAFKSLLAAPATAGGNILHVNDGDDDQNIVVDNHEVLFANLAAATAVHLNALRKAEALQSFLEALARGGSRYTEVIRSMFGVHSSDARLQRAEFIGGSSNVVAVSEVLQTSATDPTKTPQGNMAGHGISVGQSYDIDYSCEEHGWIIGFVSVMPKTAYQQGLPRSFSRFNKLDYYWYQFAHLGEQEIKNKELFLSGNAVDEDVFGYIPRYADYRYQTSTVHGQFKNSLAFWHLGRIFGSLPALNSEFIDCNPRRDIFAVEDTDVDTLLIHIWHQVDAYRPIPKWAIPSM